MLSFELFGPPLPAMALTQQMMQGINKFSLLAIPLFMFSADIISRGEISARLLRLVETTVGHLTGGVAITTTVTCALFGAVSGIGTAAIVSIGPIVYPALLNSSTGFDLYLTNQLNRVSAIPAGRVCYLEKQRRFSTDC